MRKIISVSLILCLVLTLCSGAAVQEAAGNAMETAQKELEAQVQKVLDEYKVEVVEVKTVFGKLNDEGSDWQLYCAALIKAENEDMVQGCAGALKGAFDRTGIHCQTGSKVEDPLLIHKELVFQHSDFADGTYFVLYGYKADLSIKLPELTLLK